jgi:hypothetical protein
MSPLHTVCRPRRTGNYAYSRTTELLIQRQTKSERTLEAQIDRDAVKKEELKVKFDKATSDLRPLHPALLFTFGTVTNTGHIEASFHQTNSVST